MSRGRVGERARPRTTTKRPHTKKLNFKKKKKSEKKRQRRAERSKRGRMDVKWSRFD